MSGVFPPWHWDTPKLVRERCPDVSVHGEVFSPFSQLVELLDVSDAMLALRRDAVKVRACLEALCAGTEDLMLGHARAGADAVLISSAFAGGGFISPGNYRLVLPYEKRIVRTFKVACPDVPVYTHTCGYLADRLELLQETGTDGIDTLDRLPLGDVDLADAKARVGGRLFLKGNIDECGGGIAGWLGLRSFYGRPAYHRTVEAAVYVAPAFQRRGIARRLLAHAIDAAPRAGIATLLAFVFGHNGASLSLFREAGFADWGRLPRVAELDGVERDLVILGRRLVTR